jgi:hypothetical protein
MNRNIIIHERQFVKLTWNKLQNANLNRVFLVSLILAGIISLPLVLSSFTNSATIPSSGTIATTLPLHIEGNQIRDSAGNDITLKGVDYARWIDTAYSDWMLPDGSVEWGTWDPVAAQDTLTAMKSWGCNVVRLMFTTEWWVDNEGDFRTNIQTFISMADALGIYVDLCLWRNNATGSAPTDLPWSPYDLNNNVLNSSTDFINFWASVASSLGNNSNVLFELYNEPQGDATTWFSVVQSTINAIRATGATNIIVVQYGYGCGIDFAQFAFSNSGGRTGSIWTMDWVTQYPLTDPDNNILYSTHLYRSSFYDSNQNYIEVNSPTWVNYTSNDVLWALNVTGVLNATRTYPLWIGEIGCSNWVTDQTNEQAVYSETLSLLNNSTIGTDGFAGWDFWQTGEEWGLVQSGVAGYQPSSSGQILINQLTS